MTLRHSTAALMGVAAWAAIGLAAPSASAQTSIYSGQAGASTNVYFNSSTSTTVPTYAEFDKSSGVGASITATYPAYHAPDGPSSYITIPSGQPGMNGFHDVNVPEGYYLFESSFTATSEIRNISGQAYSDNELVAAYIDGASTPQALTITFPTNGVSYVDGYTLSTPSTFALGAGTHTLDLVVHNGPLGGLPNLMALDYNLTAAPEPASWAAFAFMGLGAMGLMLKARRREAAR